MNKGQLDNLVDRSLELATISVNPYYLPEQIEGSTFLANGAYSKVYEVEDDKVLKVFIGDIGYKEFLKFLDISESFANVALREYLPVIHRSECTNRGGVVIMEKLAGFGFTDTERAHLSAINTMVKKLQMSKITVPEDQTAKLYQTFFDMCGLEYHSHSLKLLVSYLLDTANNVKDVMFDLHSLNIMSRGGIPVITDPFSC
jgi:hypothetical protein